MRRRDDDTFDEILREVDPSYGTWREDEEGDFLGELERVAPSLRVFSRPRHSDAEFREWATSRRAKLTGGGRPIWTVVGMAAGVLLALLSTLRGVDSVPTPSDDLATPRAPIVSPVPTSLEQLRRSVRDDQREFVMAVSRGADERSVRVARRALSLREIVLRDGAEAIPGLLDVLEGSPIDVMRAEAAGLLVLLEAGAGEEIYHEIVRVIDERGDSLRGLLVAMRRALLRADEMPHWGDALGKEVSGIAAMPGELQPQALDVLLALGGLGGDYSHIGISVLRQDGDLSKTAFLAFGLLSPADARVRSGELSSICLDLINDGRDTAPAALRFIRFAVSHGDYSGLRPVLHEIARDSSNGDRLRKDAARTIAALDGITPIKVFVEYDLHVRK